MENFRLSRATYQLIERAVEALERIGRELERYNDRHECDCGERTSKNTDETSRDEA